MSILEETTPHGLKLERETAKTFTDEETIIFRFNILSINMPL